MKKQPLPTITDDYVLQMRARAKQYSLMILKSGPARYQDGADTIIWEHAHRMHALRLAGLLPLMFPMNNPMGSELEGIAIFSTSVEEAKTLIDGDPGVKAGIYVYEMHPCRSFPGDSLPEESSDTRIIHQN